MDDNAQQTNGNAPAASKARVRSPLVWVVVLACLVVVGAAAFFALQSNQGEAEEQLALGLGSEVVQVSGSLIEVRGNTQRLVDAVPASAASSFEKSPQARANVEASTLQTLSQPATRQLAAQASGSVVVLEAVDLGDENTALAAARIGILDPEGKLKRKKVDTSGSDWLVGQASGYDVASSSILTRTGRAFDDECVTVAVPEGQEHLLGLPVEIVYDDMVVVATVTDTGGFAKYGRVLDLGGGVFKAFGFPTTMEWGVREVHYRFIYDTPQDAS